MSNPTSPSQVNLNACQNLENVLNPRIPLVAADVNLGPRVQLFRDVLPQNSPSPNSNRRPRRNIEKVDYRKLGGYRAKK